MRILITGKKGLVGSALQRAAKTLSHDIIFIGRDEADLTQAQEVESLFRILRPDWVIHTAAKVGGIGGNLQEPAVYFYENILMNTLMIHYAWKYKVRKFLAFSSVCIFPDGLPLLKEELMHQGLPYHTQFAYAGAKRSIDIQIEAYRKQYGINNYCSIIPGNIFGIEDAYHLNSAHVIPSLIHRIYNAKKEGKELTVWGDGSPKREFIYADDLAKIIFQLIELDHIPQRILVSHEKEITIREIVETLCDIADFRGNVLWDTQKPNGQLSRPSDLSLLRSLLGSPSYTNLKTALNQSYRWFESNYPKVRM